MNNIVSQSPSLRGSGRFGRGQRRKRSNDGRLNPLHCGAVVASGWRGWLIEYALVSIPFIAGQWSLLTEADAIVERLRSLNPLHCGAVVASHRRRSAGFRRRRVSIPFIAGQWSLPDLGADRAVSATPRLNPLHCGAVVASKRRRVPKRKNGRGVSIPFIAGQWSLRKEDHMVEVTLIVSIPFIAGQWSLPKTSQLGVNPEAVFSIPFIAGQWSLHGLGRIEMRHPRPVSIPFIAGQWSLHDLAHGHILPAPPSSQSPSLRGSGRFALAVATAAVWRACLNPLHCGAVVASRRRHRGLLRRCVASQSPSLRGSGRFLEKVESDADGIVSSQSPSLRGSGRFECRPREGEIGPRVSIPFIAGQWSLPSPPPLPRRGLGRVSIPFIAGQWSLPGVWLSTTMVM